MVNVFGGSVGSWPGDLQMVKKVVVAKVKYWNEIQHSNGLGFIPYTLRTNVDGIYVTPIRVYDGCVYVVDDVATMEIGGGQIETVKINSRSSWKTNDGSGKLGRCSARR